MNISSHYYTAFSSMWTFGENGEFLGRKRKKLTEKQKLEQKAKRQKTIEEKHVRMQAERARKKVEAAERRKKAKEQEEKRLLRVDRLREAPIFLISKGRNMMPHKSYCDSYVCLPEFGTTGSYYWR